MRDECIHVTRHDTASFSLGNLSWAIDIFRKLTVLRLAQGLLALPTMMIVHVLGWHHSIPMSELKIKYG